MEPRLLRHGNSTGFNAGFNAGKGASMEPRLLRHGNPPCSSCRRFCCDASMEPRLLRHGNLGVPAVIVEAIKEGFNGATSSQTWK